MIRNISIFSAVCIFMIIWALPLFAAGNTIYLATNGSDTNAGTQDAPVQTLSKALSLVSAGDIVLVQPGTYTQRFVINKSGSQGSPITIKANGAVIIDGQNTRDRLIEVPSGTQHIVIEGFEVKNSANFGVLLSGQYITAERLTVHHTPGMGIQTDGQHITVKQSTVYQTARSNEARQMGSQWGSGIKCRVGGSDILYEGNTVYNNYGEGIAVTRCSDVRVINNRVYDNYSVNIYVDNSYDVTVEKNFMTCSANSGFEKLDGSRPSGITMGEEYYDGWGAKLARVTIKNNLVGFCSRGVMYFGSDVPGGGLDNVTIANNTFWGTTDTTISLAYEPTKTRNTTVRNNIAQQPEGKVAFIENPAGITLSHNFWVRSTTPEDWRNATGTGDKFGNVQLAVTPAYTPTSYRLSSTSPAIGGGLVLTAVTDDYEGKSRSGTNDMGAIQFSGTIVASPTPSPSPSPSVVPTPSPSPSLSPTPSPSITPSPTPSPTPGNLCRNKRQDINADGKVNVLDFAMLSDYFTSTNKVYQSNLDVVEDSKINVLDVADVIANLMRDCP